MASTKKLNALPTLTQMDSSQSILLTDAAGSAYNLPVSVLRSEIAATLPISEADYAYGVEFDTTVASPALTRIGNLALHASLPIHSRMRGCLLNDSGEVVEYLDPNDWTAADRSGARGMVMVEIPEHYQRFVTDGTKRRVMLSEYPLPGYTHVPKCYVSAYEATVDRTDASKPKLASVVNTTAAFRGGAGTESDLDGTDKTLLGRPATMITRHNLRIYARNRNDGDTRWNMLTYDAWKTLVWLYVVEYANLNSQEEYNSEPTPQGYKQGGLGEGVTTVTTANWADFNNSKPFIPCGVSDNLGNRTGVTQYTASTDLEPSGNALNVPRYRGIENIFGHINQTCDGILIYNSPDEENGGDGTSKVYICSDPADFSDTDASEYRYAGLECRTASYIKHLLFGEYGDVVPSEVGGSSSTYFCDRLSSGVSRTNPQWRCEHTGGRAADNSAAGMFYLDSYASPTFADKWDGTRLCFIPSAS